VTNAGEDYTFAYVSITGGDGTGASAEVRLQSTIGQLRMFYYKADGEKVVINDSVGSIDYITGEVMINSLRAFSVEQNDFYDDNVLTITAQSEDDTIRPLRNRILTIDENDPRGIDIQMIAE
jgi:hypothetical protein